MTIRDETRRDETGRERAGAGLLGGSRDGALGRRASTQAEGRDLSRPSGQRGRDVFKARRDPCRRQVKRAGQR
jgi:hypothetical protein